MKKTSLILAGIILSNTLGAASALAQSRVEGAIDGSIQSAEQRMLNRLQNLIQAERSLLMMKSALERSTTNVIANRIQFAAAAASAGLLSYAAYRTAKLGGINRPSVGGDMADAMGVLALFMLGTGAAGVSTLGMLAQEISNNNPKQETLDLVKADLKAALASAAQSDQSSDAFVTLQSLLADVEGLQVAKDQDEKTELYGRILNAMGTTLSAHSLITAKGTAPGQLMVKMGAGQFMMLAASVTEETQDELLNAVNERLKVIKDLQEGLN